MIVGNKSIPGIFLYSDDVEYETGDFIVKDSKIYICTPKQGNSIVGKDPAIDKENFSNYLGGNDPVTWEDFKNQFDNYTETITNDNKVVTGTSLSNILKKLVFGINSDSIIDESISPITVGIQNILTSHGYSGNNPIDLIDYFILNGDIPEFNNLTIRVSRDLLKTVLPSIGDSNNIESKSVILRQYTYYEDVSIMGNEVNTTKNKIRIQEIIDHVLGVCFYRYYRFGNEYELDNTINSPSSWKISCPSYKYLNNLNSLLKFVTDKLNTLDDTSSFKFIDITDKFKESTDNNIDTGSTTKNKKVVYNVSPIYILDKTLTITIYSKFIGDNESSSSIYSHSMTINFNTTNTYYTFSNGVTIKFIYDINKTGAQVQVLLEWNSDSVVVWIGDVYSRSKKIQY